MRSDTSATPSPDDENTPARPAAKAQVIPIDTTSKPMALFFSEQKTADHKPADHKPAEPKSADHKMADHKTAELKTAKPDLDVASATESHDAERVPLLPPEPEPKVRKEHPHAPPVVVSRGIGRRQILVAVLALAVIAQGGFIAFDRWWGAAAVLPPETGSLSVTSDPSGSPVVIDGTVRGATPLKVTLAPGTHTVEVGTGSQARSQQLTVTRGGDSSVHVGLMPATATAGVGGLQIATEPAGARVWIDGEPHGVAPVTVSNLKVGDHVVTVRGSSGDAVNRTVTVQEATVASLIVSMNAGGAFASGWLAITSGVPLQILEKGTILGTTETPRILLPAGAHELELVNAELGYRVTRSVQISAGQTAAVALKPPMGTVSVNAVPWAEVWIDGQRAGETPIGNFAIPIGRHELLFRHPDLGEQRRTVTVGVTSPVRVSADMRKP